MLYTLWRSIDDNVDLMTKDKVHKVRCRLLQLICTDNFDSVFFEDFCSSQCSIDSVSKCFESSCDRDDILFVFVFNSDDHVFVFRKTDTSSDKCFIKCFVKCLSNTKALTCRFHFRSKTDISATDLLK